MLSRRVRRVTASVVRIVILSMRSSWLPIAIVVIVGANRNGDHR